MARYKKGYSGQHRTEKVTVQLKPCERKKFEKAAAKSGATLSQYTRELCLRRHAAAQIVAGARRNPEARKLMNALTAIGNNLDQIGRVFNQTTKAANTTRKAPHLTELRSTTTAIKRACRHVLKL
jgi:hypothetical protein